MRYSSLKSPLFQGRIPYITNEGEVYPLYIFLLGERKVPSQYFGAFLAYFHCGISAPILIVALGGIFDPLLLYESFFYDNFYSEPKTKSTNSVDD